MSNKKQVYLIKLGGSIITNKEIPMSLRKAVLANLVEQIAEARKKLPEALWIVGHGQGSFAHIPATKYKTMSGFINEESVMGMAITQDSAAQLNRRVVYEFIRHQMPAVSFNPSNTVITANRSPDQFFWELLEAYLEKGLLPITGGDVLLDTEQGCTIWSTEEVLTFFARQLRQHGYEVARLVHVAEVPGVLDTVGNLVPEINQANWPEFQKAIGRTKGFDVTGGMGLKITESLELAKMSIESRIVSGLKKDNLFMALTEGDWRGTRVVA